MQLSIQTAEFVAPKFQIYMFFHFMSSQADPLLISPSRIVKGKSRIYLYLTLSSLCFNARTYTYLYLSILIRVFSLASVLSLFWILSKQLFFSVDLKRLSSEYCPFDAEDRKVIRVSDKVGRATTNGNQSRTSALFFFGG